jgi:hypothetical protein
VGELGDCFLLTIKTGKVTRYILIDCGSFRNGKKSSDRLIEVVKDIKKQIKKSKINVAVGTHQHNDHLSGYVHAESLFKQIGIEQIWLSWLDNPSDSQAAKIGDSHKGLRKALHQASAKMEKMLLENGANNKAYAPKMRNTKEMVDGLLGFFGAAPELPSKGIENLKKMGDKPVEYLSPGEIIAIPGIPLTDIKVYVLGPPKNEKLLYRKDPKAGESYDPLNAMNYMAGNFLASLDNLSDGNNQEEEQFPFNSTYKQFVKKGNLSPDLSTLIKSYKDTLNQWRNIDHDWLDQAARLALYMDTFTNNSSLILAIELVRVNKFLLFAADAQTGNWVSWWDVKFDNNLSIDNLLAKTVFYKVGHHGSHNATLKDALEKMTHDELVAMIPVHKKDPNITKPNGWKMPAKNLYKRLKEKTNYRVIRMEDGFADDCDPTKNPLAKAAWKKLTSQPIAKEGALYQEFEVS